MLAVLVAWGSVAEEDQRRQAPRKCAAKMAALPVSAPPGWRLSQLSRRRDGGSPCGRAGASDGRLGGTPRPTGRWRSRGTRDPTGRSLVAASRRPCPGRPVRVDHNRREDRSPSHRPGRQASCRRGRRDGSSRARGVSGRRAAGRTSGRRMKGGRSRAPS